MNYLRSRVPDDAESVRAKKNNYSHPLLRNTHNQTTRPRQLYFSRSSTNQVAQKTKKRGPAPTSQILEPPRFAHFPKPVWPNLQVDFPRSAPKNYPCASRQKKGLGGVRVSKNPFGSIWMYKHGPRAKRFSLKFPKAPKKSPSAPPHQNKNPKFAGFRKCQKLDFSIPRPGQNFSPTHF